MSERMRRSGTLRGLRPWLVKQQPWILQAGVEQTILVQDSFTDLDHVKVQDHTPDIDVPDSGWNGWDNVHKILSNKAYNPTNWDYRISFIDCGSADYFISARISAQSGNGNVQKSPGIVVRFQDGQNCWLIVINSYGDTFRIVERAASVNTVRATASVSLNAGQEYLVEAIINETVISATLDGVNPISYNNALFNRVQTRAGILLPQVGETADDFLVISV